MCKKISRLNAGFGGSLVYSWGQKTLKTALFHSNFREISMTKSSVDPDQIFKTDHYDFDLPKDLIAQHPLNNREDARLMVVDRASQSIQHRHVRDLDEILSPRDCLILNDTKVIPAKLVGFRTLTGGRWQGLLLKTDEQGNWKVLCKTRGNAQPGETVTLQDRNGLERLQLDLVSRLDDGSWVVRPQSDDDTQSILEQVGRIPLPNYIRGGNMVDADVQDYQTIFAKHAGAVAAPTAGLHLTKGLLNRLIDAGINIAQITLHVGVGTFRPVSTAQLDDHAMHSEWGHIDEKTVAKIEQTRGSEGRVIAVGTTSVRVLETAGSTGTLSPWAGETDLFIKPPYEFKFVDAMMTNFHLPRSTLLVMIRTFGGDELMTRAYEEAVAEKYRFFSYGDAMLIL
ncbi:tRNA preQ1(34) S-adenosylmethionine ribosyltransferase-isomerase QueA [Saprospiraceae bacterium]|nr:tRNA preQ1(34) S-adenosylmethionine ribosyltransferase-isomerase QueA [Saprospiraceae bacterium]